MLTLSIIGVECEHTFYELNVKICQNLLRVYF